MFLNFFSKIKFMIRAWFNINYTSIFSWSFWCVTYRSCCYNCWIIYTCRICNHIRIFSITSWNIVSPWIISFTCHSNISPWNISCFSSSIFFSYYDCNSGTRIMYNSTWTLSYCISYCCTSYWYKLFFI